jgi:hypothetical protein
MLAARMSERSRQPCTCRPARGMRQSHVMGDTDPWQATDMRPRPPASRALPAIPPRCRPSRWPSVGGASTAPAAGIRRKRPIRCSSARPSPEPPGEDDRRRQRLARGTPPPRCSGDSSSARSNPQNRTVTPLRRRSAVAAHGTFPHEVRFIPRHATRTYALRIFRNEAPLVRPQDSATQRSGLGTRARPSPSTKCYPFADTQRHSFCGAAHAGD